MFKGWKGALGGIIAIIGGVSTGLSGAGIHVPILGDIAQALIGVGAGLGIYGVRAKQERDNPRT